MAKYCAPGTKKGGKASKGSAYPKPPMEPKPKGGKK